MGTTGIGAVPLPEQPTASVPPPVVPPRTTTPAVAPAQAKPGGAPRWLPFVIAPIAALTVALAVWALWPGDDPNARDGVSARVDVPTADGGSEPPPVVVPEKHEHGHGHEHEHPPAADSGKAPPPPEVDTQAIELPPPPEPDADIEVVRPMATQPSFSGSACTFLGWSKDGSRYVLDMTYPDRVAEGEPSNRLRLAEVHDALTGAMVASYLLEREAAPEISERDRLARAAAEAEPSGELVHTKRELELGHLEATRLPPSGVARIEATLEGVPMGTVATVTETDTGASFRWSIGTLPAGDEELQVPHVMLRWQAGDERWELLDVPLVVGARELAALAEPGATVEYVGTLSYHWAPAARRVVVRIEGLAEHVTTPARTIDARWFLRASGPQIRLVDAGAGQRKLRQIAAQLERAGLPIAAADLDHSAAEGSRTYVRARDAAAAELAVRINTALGLELPSALLQRVGWTQAVVVLGPDLATHEP